MQLLTLVSIIVSEILIYIGQVSQSYAVIILLCATVYTAYTSGVKQGLVSATLVVAYTYVVIIRATEGPWFNLDTLQRGAVMAITFPILAFVIGRLKERNDMLLQGEHSARRKAEESERQLRFMSDYMPQKVFTAKPNGEILYKNPPWGEYSGEPSKKAKALGWRTTVHPDDIDENNRLWKHALRTGEPFQFEHRLQRKDGRYVWHITRAHALRDETGKVALWIGSTTDIEDIKKRRQLEASEAKLIKQRQQLMELNMAKDEFISLASHQLRTPATGVKQYINMVLDGYAGEISPAVRAFLEKASNSNERQLEVIHDLLRVAQLDAGKVVLQKESVNASRLIADIINEQSSKFSSRNQTVSYIKPKSPIYVNADATKIRMVIENIIDNASKYTPNDKIITVRLVRSGTSAKISVKDEGVGIPKGDMDKVFEKFIRLSNPMSTEVGGTGIGLYWVKKVVELHGGDISVTSVVDKGSTFTVTLPLA